MPLSFYKASPSTFSHESFELDSLIGRPDFTLSASALPANALSRFSPLFASPDMDPQAQGTNQELSSQPHEDLMQAAAG